MLLSSVFTVYAFGLFCSRASIERLSPHWGIQSARPVEKVESHDNNRTTGTDEANNPIERAGHWLAREGWLWGTAQPTSCRFISRSSPS